MKPAQCPGEEKEKETMAPLSFFLKVFASFINFSDPMPGIPTDLVSPENLHTEDPGPAGRIHVVLF